MQIEALTNEVNQSAIEHYRKLCEQTGVPYPKYKPTWLALRQNTPYPYRFYQRDSMFPPEGTGFGGVVIKDRDSGLTEIHSTIEQVTEEHAWFYVPNISIWIDATQGTSRGSVDSDQYLVTFLSYMSPLLEMVHSHPDRVVEELYREGICGYTENYLIEASTPSTPDMIRHQQLFSRINPACQLITSVVSHYGVVSMELNEIGKKARASGGDPIEHVISSENDPREEVQRFLIAARNRRTELVYDRPRKPIFDFSFTPFR